MQFKLIVKRQLIDIFELLSVLLCFAFLMSQIWPFFDAAVNLDMLNGATMAYVIYGVLLFIMPLVLLSYSGRIHKVTLLSLTFYALSAVIFFGTVWDLITYKGFSNYVFSEGDAVFVNIMWNMADFGGVILSFVVSALFFALGKWVKRRRRVSYVIFLLIVISVVFVPFVYTYINTGYLPRSTWLEKATFILPEYLLLTVSFTISASSRELWKLHMWN